MELLVLDTEFKSSDTLDIFESLIWTDRYFECGDFEIYTPAESEIMKMLPKGYYLYLKESEHIMIIEDVEIETDAEQGAHLKITGRSLESILDRRIIWGQTILSGSLQDGIKKLLNENVISPSDENRKIPNLNFRDSDDVRIKALTLEAQYYGDNLYDALVDICKSAGIGFKITLENTNLVFSLYMGIDRSYSQTYNSYVVFSPGFDNLMNSNYIESIKTLKNVTLVAGEGEGSDRKTTTVYLGSSSPSGLDRRELFTDASGVSQTVEGGTLSDTEYLSQLAQKGNEELSNNTETVSFEGEVDISATYVYDSDYFLGDVVQVGNEFGNEARCRITEFVRSQDETGNEYYPTFETLDNFTENNPFAIRLTKVAGSSIKVNDRSYTKTNTEPVVFIPWNPGNSTYTGWMVLGRTSESIRGIVTTVQYCTDMQATINGRPVFIKHLGNGMCDNADVAIKTENYDQTMNPNGIYTIGYLDENSSAVIDDFDNYWLQYAENLLYKEDKGEGTSEESKLPDGYEKLNYVKFDGNQCIDSITLEASFEITFDCMLSETSSYYNLYDSSSRGLWISPEGLLELNGNSNRASVEKNKRILVTSSALGSSNVVMVNSNPVISISKISLSETVALFNRSKGQCFKGSIYGIEVYSSSSLTYEFIPCKNSSGVIGFFETVHKKFYQNIGGGSFTGG